MSTSETMMYDWKTILWRKLEVIVFKLQKRIYQASCRGEAEAVHKLQRLLGDVAYWSGRAKALPGRSPSLHRLLAAQQGSCPACGLFFKPGDHVSMAWRFEGRAGGLPGQTVLLHKHCQDSSDGRYVMTTHHFAEEPDEGKLSRPVLKTSANREVRA